MTNQKSINILHCAVTVSSEQAATDVFETLFGMSLLYAFDIPGDTIETLFGIHRVVNARVYDGGNSRVEVFILSDPPPPGPFQHICFEIPDREEICRRAETMGFEIRRIVRGESTVVFIIDPDGNLFEVKSAG